MIPVSYRIWFLFQVEYDLDDIDEELNKVQEENDEGAEDEDERYVKK